MGGQEGSTEGFELLVPPDVHTTPQKLWEPASSVRGARLKSLCTLHALSLKSPWAQPLQRDGDHTHLEHNPCICSLFPFIPLLLRHKRYTPAKTPASACRVNSTPALLVGHHAKFLELGGA